MQLMIGPARARFVVSFPRAPDLAAPGYNPTLTTKVPCETLLRWHKGIERLVGRIL